VRDALAPGASVMLNAQATFMRQCAESLTTKAMVDRQGRQSTLQAFDTGAQSLRDAGVTRALGFDAAGPVFALVFALDSLHRNLNDLADRIDETVSGRSIDRDP